MSNSWFFRALGKAGIPTRSEPHGSKILYPTENSGVPIWILGFARTGTTTAQSILGEAFRYNTSFEPFGYDHANLPSFEGANRYFIGNPSEQQRAFFEAKGICPAALSTIVDEDQRGELFRLFSGHLDSIYAKYGLNVVVKELRTIPNIEALVAYHRERSMSVEIVGLLAHPYSPLYTYYRLGGLHSQENPSNLRVSDLYDYRIDIYSALDLFADIRSLETNNAADKLVVSVLLDQAMIEFARAEGWISKVFGLHELADHVAAIAERIGHVTSDVELPKIAPSRRYLDDKYFHKYVLSRLSRPVASYVEEQYSFPPAGNQKLKNGLRARVTAFRHFVYGD